MGFFDGLRRDKRNKEAAASSVEIVQEDPKVNDSTPEEEQFEDALDDDDVIEEMDEESVPVPAPPAADRKSVV